MVTQDAIETAYSFFHQKLRVYEHSSLSWQRDDIEVAIEDYVNSMNRELYENLSGGSTTYLRDHSRFEGDLRHAVSELEHRLF